MSAAAVRPADVLGGPYASASERSALEHAAGILAEYESRQDVTFIGLDTLHLEHLREVWEGGDSYGDYRPLVAGIRDLFGGIDGHLTVIDQVLPR